VKPDCPIDASSGVSQEEHDDLAAPSYDDPLAHWLEVSTPTERAQ
jgi:hypothetical protein